MKRSPLVAALLLTATLAWAPRASAQVLVWSTGNSQTNTQAVANYLTASNLFGTVTAIDSTNLTLANLSEYKAVLFFTNSSTGSDSLNGNVLADYAALGRPLVLATFSWANQGGNTLSGRIITDGISPVVLNGSSAYSNVSMASNDGSVFFTGVTSVTGYYHDRVTAATGATIRATWSDGTPLLVTKNNVVAVNLFPDPVAGSSNLSGDYQKLFVNALYYAVPEPSTYALMAVGLGLVFWLRRRAASRDDSEP